MSALSIQPTYPIFTDIDGQPLEDGYVWIGTANLDPQTNPINVYWDAALTLPAAQPIRTLDGYPSNSGTPARLYVNSDYSIRVMNKNGSMVYSAPQATERYSAALVAFTGFKGQVGTVEDLAGNDGADWIGFEPAGLDAVSRSVQDKLRDAVSVLDFGADPTGLTDTYAEVQAAFDAVAAKGGGTVYFPSGTYLCNTPLVLQYGVNLIGESRANTKILKDSTTTKAVTVYASALIPEIYAPSVLPNNINAILVLTGTPGPGRYTGTISDITFEGTYAIAGNYESQKVQLGIVSVGSVSDFTLQNCNINQVEYGAIFPTIFVAEIRNNRISRCLHGLGIDGSSTSTAISTNYANDCRTYGFYLRALYYSEVSGNAVDFLNDFNKYPDRTRLCQAYVFRTMRGCTVVNNGQEQTLGRNWVLLDFKSSIFEGNFSIGLGSDYTGADEIAWIYSDNTLQGSLVKNNSNWTYNANGLLFGGANPAKHHNIYFTSTDLVRFNEFTNNWVRQTFGFVPIEAGYLNNVPSNEPNLAVGGELVATYTNPLITAAVPGDLSVTYNANNKHFQHFIGKLAHVWGCFDVTITYTTASGRMEIGGLPFNENQAWAIAVSGVQGGSGLAKKLGHFLWSNFSITGVWYDENDAQFNITDIPTGTTVKIFYDGWIQRLA